MAAPYLTKAQAVTRLSDPDTGYGYTAAEAGIITGGDLRAASDELDAMSPFIGARPDDDQVREWPRQLRLRGTPGDPAETPDPVLDWVALKAFELSADEDPAIKSHSVLDESITYAVPAASKTQKRMARLLDPYLLWTGSRT